MPAHARVRHPAALSPGDRVAIVSPASGLAAQYAAVYERGLERIETAFDLVPVEYPTATADDDYLAANPAARASDVEDAFADPEIGGVIATIGGNDQIRVLRHLDRSVLREHATRFFGLSDNTNLAIALWNAGVVSFYGGHVLTSFACPGPIPDYLDRWLRTALFDDAFGALAPAPRFTDADGDWEHPATLDEEPEWEPDPDWYWHGGDGAVAGHTWGGNLEIVSLQLAADRSVPPVDALEGSVLLLETSEELPSPGMVTRAMQGLGERGVLGAVDAVLFGRVKARSHRKARDRDERRAYRESLREALVDEVERYNPAAPVVCGLEFGLTHPSVPVPLGATAHVDPGAERIALDLP